MLLDYHQLPPLLHEKNNSKQTYMCMPTCRSSIYTCISNKYNFAWFNSHKKQFLNKSRTNNPKFLL
jgi:hypothetical protein